MNSSKSKVVGAKYDFEFCGNTNCNKRTNELVEAPLFLKAYLGVGNTAKICSGCLANANNYIKMSKEIVRNSGVLFSLPKQVQSSIPPNVDIVNLVDNEDEVLEASFTQDAACTAGKGVKENSCQEQPYYLIEEDRLLKYVDKMMKKFGLTEQVTKCRESLKNDICILENQVSALEQEFKEKEITFHQLVQTCKNTFKLDEQIVEIETVDLELECPDIDIDENANSGAIEVLTTPKNGILRGKSTSHRKGSNEYAPPSNLSIKHLLSQALKWKKPREGQLVYYMNGTSLQFWVLGNISKIEIDSFKKTLYTVRFDSTHSLNQKSKIKPNILQVTKQLYGNQIAFAKEPDLLEVNLSVGSRIIAKFEDMLGNNAAVNGMYYAGVVGESKSTLNKNRYLIFFDDDYVSYIDPANVIPVVEPSIDVSQDVHHEFKEFIQNYLSQCKDRVLLKVKTGNHMKVEYTGVFEDVIVKQIDCSIMKIKYIKNPKLGYEWIHRGSPRLLFIQLLLKTKSTSAPRMLGNIITSHESAPPIKVFPKSGLVDLTENDLAVFMEYETGGTSEKIAIPENCPSPKEYSAHNCSFTCGYKYEERTFRAISPLVVPFYLGWAREIKPGKKGGNINYVTPCGIHLKTYHAIHQYIQITGISIPIEFFSLKTSIDCLNYFKPVRKLSRHKDISCGMEGAPVECVNALNYELPEQIEYSSCRIPVGVPINQDTGFMVCCDCQDDCQDSAKCACKNLTLSGLSFKKDQTLDTYSFRRLGKCVQSGIYECNQGCKCNVNTCLNRVVQSKVQWPLQIFKTVKKGWGVRALYDIPKGSFLCVYTGKLLNGSAANKEGQINGDMYLADLDYIEGMEIVKEGYEANCKEVVEEKEKLEKTPNISQTEPILAKRKSKENSQVARKCTTGISMKTTLAQLESKEGSQVARKSTARIPRKNKKISYREYFDEDGPYTIDGNIIGNFGRYLNHSCDPNVFIQPVFVDTHDLRFPWIAFFTNRDVKAGTELCWDYKYEVNSVPGTKLICHCNAKNCRKRLL